MMLPARAEGPHLSLGHLVAVEAKRLAGFAPHVPHRHIPLPVVHERLEAGLWAWLRTGWCRVEAAGESPRLVYWREDRETWVRYDKELDAYYRTLPATRITSVLAHQHRN